MKKKKPSPLCSSSIEVPVNNIITKVLVDTGAAISLIHETALQSMKHKPIDACSLKEVHTANTWQRQRSEDTEISWPPRVCGFHK